jgi:hypothetical protein
VPGTRLRAIVILGCLLILAGCSVIGVRPAEERTLFDNWIMSLNPGSAISTRTQQTLRQLDLEQSFRDSPHLAFQRLIAMTSDAAPPDQLFALAELSYRLGREEENKRMPQACQYYYLCAGYSYHYLFGMVHHQGVAGAAHAQQVLPLDCFDPRFGLACELYNRALA